MSTAPQVEYRRLGKCGLRVSVPILGGMSFGSSKWHPWVLDEAEALPLLKAAWEKGVNTWDTANNYSNGESERIIGKAIKEFNIPRHRLVILTKCFSIPHDEVDQITYAMPTLKDTRDYVNQGGLTRAAIFNQVEASLKRLDTPYIDLLQIHRADLDNATAEETMKSLHDLVQSGKVRYIGASSMYTWQLAHYNHVADKNGWTQFVSMQNWYNLIYREEEREMNAYCKFNGIGIIPWGPLKGGKLARPIGGTSQRFDHDSSFAKQLGFDFAYSRDWEVEVINRIEKLSKEKGWSMAQVGLAWVNAKVTSPIVGFSSIKRLEEAIIPGYTLTEEEMKHLEEPYQPLPIQGHW